MRVVILTETFAKNMGYAERLLSKYLARLGVEVHVVTLDLPPYYQLKHFKETYRGFTNFSDLIPGTVEELDGFKLHVVGHRKVLGYMRIEGLFDKLKSLRPDIVQTFAAISWIPLDAAMAKLLLGFKLFTGSHTTASTFPLAKRKLSLFDKELIRSIITRFVPGRFVSLFTEKCYSVTIDCADIAKRFFGVQKGKVEIMHLGVDTDFFFPVHSETTAHQRAAVRAQHGISPSGILCIYTGKLTVEKNALILVQAIERLRVMGEPFHGLFIGEGVQREAIQSHPSCTALPFLPFNELGSFYRAADIGVWPTNESTSMLDAAACGIPIIISDGVVYREHVHGNGLVYKMNNLDDMVRTLLKLRDPAVRENLGSAGALKMKTYFSWEAIAKRRLNDYESSISR
jgi:glycosyltransferase involved in cell wall biosynthesis